MSEFKRSLAATLIHGLEIALAVASVWVIMTLFGVDDTTMKLLVGFLANLVLKFGRTHEDIPLRDYVNER